MALLSHLDLYCFCLGISQGLPHTVQGCWKSLWSWKIKSKKTNPTETSTRCTFILFVATVEQMKTLLCLLFIENGQKFTPVVFLLQHWQEGRREGYAHKRTFSSHFNLSKRSITHIYQQTLSKLLIDFFSLFVFERKQHIFGEPLSETAPLYLSWQEQMLHCTQRISEINLLCK